MVIESRFSTSAPNCSIQTWIFGSSSDPLAHGDRKAWIDADNPDERFLTYTSARLLAKRVAAGLIEKGLQPGDRVLVISGNSIVFPAIMIGIWMAGGNFTGANLGCVSRELAFQLRGSEAKFMLAAESSWDVASAAASTVGLGDDNIFLIDGSIPGVDPDRPAPSDHWLSLLAPAEKAEKFKWEEPVDSRETTCCLNYSSGTTGLPKGAEITHYNQVANGHGLVQLDKLAPDYEEQTNRAAALCFLPMYHAFAQGYFITVFPHEGVPVYVMPQFDLAKMLRHITAFRITKLFAVPPILVLLSKHPLARCADLSSLERVASGAAPPAKNTQMEVSRLMAEGYENMVRQGWGMTEVTSTALAWDPTRDEVSGVGELMPGCKAKLVCLDSRQEILEPGVPGELLISAPTLMKAYWRNPEATKRAVAIDSDGSRWLHTGDIAYVSPEYENGTLFHIVDRAKELIKVRGYQVSPAVLEALLLEREDVIDAAVVGVAINGEELPRAYIVPKPSPAPTTATEIQGWIAKRVVRYKKLKGGVVFVEAIPKNPAGKILRKALKERARLENDGTLARL